MRRINYNIVLFSMVSTLFFGGCSLERDVPESLVLVTEALRPLIGMREELARRGQPASGTRGEAGRTGKS